MLEKLNDSIYTAYFDYAKGEKESRASYLYRVQPLLPNFPEEVLIQWLYDHSQQINDHEWLNYPSIIFEKQKWETEQIPIDNLGNVEAVKSYMNHYLNGMRSEKVKPIASHFEQYGTWPIPPIFLSNPDGNLKYPSGYLCGTPYHLIEGHNRMSLFFVFKEQIKLAPKHELYLITSYDKNT